MLSSYTITSTLGSSNVTGSDFLWKMFFSLSLPVFFGISFKMSFCILEAG